MIHLALLIDKLRMIEPFRDDGGRLVLHRLSWQPPADLPLAQGGRNCVKTATRLFRRGLFSMIGCVTLALLGCTATLETIESEPKTPPTPEQVAVLATQTLNQLRRTQTIAVHPRLMTYTECVVNSLTAMLPDKSGNSKRWEVILVRDPIPNLVAWPGAQVTLHTGILRTAKNQDELAAIIAHEIAHLQFGHVGERLINPPTPPVVAQGAPPTRSAGSAASAAIFGFPGSVLQPYTPEQERVAAQASLDLVSRAGFDPRQSVAFWNNLQTVSRGQLWEIAATDPAYLQRLAALQAQMNQAVTTWEAARKAGIRPRCGRPPR